MSEKRQQGRSLLNLRQVRRRSRVDQSGFDGFGAPPVQIDLTVVSPNDDRDRVNAALFYSG